MNQLPANTGWLWVRQGYDFFKKQPLEFSTLFLGYLFFMLVIGSIPVLGQILSFVFLPLFTIAFMQACKEIDQGTKAHPRLLLYGFQSPHMGRLLQLGVLYLIAAITSLGASALIDDGIFVQIMTGQLELSAKNIANTNMVGAMFFALLVYIPALMAFWFAGPLIAWQGMPVVKAVFYSFFATWRSAKVFLVYGLAWFTVGGVLPTLISIFIAAITGYANMIILIMMPFSMILTIVLYCSFYPTYRSVFGQPAATAPTASSTIS